MELPSLLPVSDFAILDGGRRVRIGMPEAVYAPGKTQIEAISIVGTMIDKTPDPVIVTRAGDALCLDLKREFGHLPHFSISPGLDVSSPYRTVTMRNAKALGRTCAIVTAGTSDLRVAWECSATLGALGVVNEIISDVGVAGLDRTLAALPRLRTFDVVVVVAGMEGALASVLGGLLAQPIVATPTSTGYGSSFEGVTALAAMTASCAQGISVVGIDNGFGAACAVARIVNASIGGARSASV